MEEDCGELVDSGDRVAQSRTKQTESEFVYFYGSCANVHWKVISREDLRYHPLYQPLPDPSTIAIHSFRDLSKFSQDSWQWEYLHKGRLTTSQLAAVLGFYENSSSTFLKIPDSLRSHNRAVFAYEHLRRKGPSTYFDLQARNVPAKKQKRMCDNLRRSPWVTPTSAQNTAGNFAFLYCPYLNDQSSNDDNSETVPSLSTSSSEMAALASQLYAGASHSAIRNAIDARLAWGHVQEPVGVLVAINYFASASNSSHHRPTAHPGSTVLTDRSSSAACSHGCCTVAATTVIECGMCTFEGACLHFLNPPQEQHVLCSGAGIVIDNEEVTRGVDSSSTGSGGSSSSSGSGCGVASSLSSGSNSLEIYHSVQSMLLKGMLPPLGASPDGLIYHHRDCCRRGIGAATATTPSAPSGDITEEAKDDSGVGCECGGMVEVLEVKCKSPFFGSSGVLNSSSNRCDNQCSATMQVRMSSENYAKVAAEETHFMQSRFKDRRLTAASTACSICSSFSCICDNAALQQHLREAVIQGGSDASAPLLASKTKIDSIETSEAAAATRPPEARTISGGGALPAWHMPQLQLEILCAGPRCTSAVVVQLECERATLFRVRRDDQVR
jgi:hypothetical protein